MSVDSILTQRADVSRLVELSTDDYGHPENELTTHLRSLPVFLKPLSKRKFSDTERVSLMIRYRGYAYESADLRFEDRITAVEDRAGNSFISGTLRITEVVRWPGSHVSFECEVPRVPGTMAQGALGSFSSAFSSAFDV